MGGKRRNLWALPLIAVIMVAVVSVLYAVAHMPEQRRNDFETYWGFVLALVIPAAGWIAWVWRKRTRQGAATPDAQELDQLAEQLAGEVGKQWDGEANERRLLWPEPIPVRWKKPSAAVAGSAAAAVESTRFQPLPGLHPITEEDLDEGDIRDLHAVYGGLGSGRLVIAGAAGSGKSGAAVLLVLDALRHREHLSEDERAEVPVPVLFTTQDWDPVDQPLRDWLVLQLQGYPVFADKPGAVNAAGLIDDGKVALILDGLDEMAEDLRPAALQALSEQAPFRVVVLSRTAEMASAASQRGVLEGAAAIELQNIDPATAADFLNRVQVHPLPNGWKDLINRIDSAPGSPLAQALASPLTLTIVRDTYREGDNVRELLEFYDTASPEISHSRLTEDIVDHLLDRVMPAAYTPRPGNKAPPYDLQAVQGAFVEIAVQMNRDGTRDLEVRPVYLWPSGVLIFIIRGFSAGLPAGIVAGLIGGSIAGVMIGIVTGLAVFIPVAAIHSTAFWAAAQAIKRSRRQSREPQSAQRSFQALSFRLSDIGPGIRSSGATSAVSGLLAWLAAWIVLGFSLGFGSGLLRALLVGLAVAILYWVIDVLGFALSIWVWSRRRDTALSPLTLWRNDRRLARMTALVDGIVIGIGAGLVIDVKFGPAYGLATGAVIGVTYGLYMLLSRAASYLLVSFQLAKLMHTPVRLMKFLEDARHRNVLRTVGPVYQFRHARLQDRLAEQATASAAAHDPSKATAV